MHRLRQPAGERGEDPAELLRQREAGINIAGAQVSRTTQGGDALMAVTVDSPVSGQLLADIAGRIGARQAQAADLNPS